MDWGSTIANIVLSLLITIFGYLLVPIIIILKGSKHDAKKLKKINRINCTVVWILFRIIRTAISGEPGTGAAVFLWGAVGQWLLNKYCIKDETSAPNSVSQPSTQTSQVRVCLSNEEEIPRAYKPHLTTGTDVALTQDTASSTSPVQHKVTPKPVKQGKYCSRCGSIINPDTKKCQSCGKQYFKGIPWKKVFAVFLVLLLIVSLVLNVVSYIACKEIVLENKELSSENEKLTAQINDNQKQKQNLEKELKASYKQFEEISDLVVFVEDDGSRLYHRFECEKFKGDSFWAFNVDAAKSKGYKECTLCHYSDGSLALTWTEEYNRAMLTHIVGEDLEISASELKQLSKNDLVVLMTHDGVVVSPSWQGLYHKVTCERLAGNCKVDIKSVVEKNGLLPCPACLK